ncbi:hypothetical protein A1O1_06370 [Capronia coronata CBS 617.96]|uniref:Uncharacterized protein n=1 Tax=Capronia coronata CBS 617.96 TaxID=1182541 RepID=W9Y9T2_9EURO|nr:uncharacterized protein A1O1_06370 [Capronia coronata CBS 617.96]EXJ86001.1 hypothetical protein A1O1_06370 [Capronia coronata CBS 617.96]
MDMGPDDIDLDDLEYNEHIYHIAVNSQRERLRRSAAAPFKAVFTFLSMVYNYLLRLRSNSVGNALFWVILTLSFLVLAGAVTVVVFLTISTWLHGLKWMDPNFSYAPTTSVLSATPTSPWASLHYTAPVAHKNVPVGMLHPDNRPPVPRLPLIHDDPPPSNESSHKRNLENCATNLLQRLLGDDVEASTDMETALNRCQTAISAVLKDLFSPKFPPEPAKSRSGAWKWVVFMVLLGFCVLGARFLLRKMRFRLRGC